MTLYVIVPADPGARIPVGAHRRELARRRLSLAEIQRREDEMDAARRASLQALPAFLSALPMTTTQRRDLIEDAAWEIAL